MGTKKPKARKAKGDIEIGAKFTKLLPRAVDDKAVRRKQQEIYEALSERAIEREKAKPHNDAAKEAASRVEKLRKEIKSRVEDVEVMCQDEFDYAHRVVRVRRLDTKKLVKELERTMNDDDMQTDALVSKPANKKRETAPAAHAKDQAAAESAKASEDALDDALPLDEVGDVALEDEQLDA